MRMSKLKYLLIIPLILLSLWALSWGLSDIFAGQTLRYERSWLKNDHSVDEIDEWNKAKYWATLASSLNASNPDHYEMLGRLYFWRFLVEDSPVTSPEEWGQYLNQGLLNFRSAIERRPTWPETWARLLRLKSITGNLDEEFWYAWDKSQQLGRWETFIQEKLLESGLQHWGVLTNNQQNKVLSVLSDMISKPYSQLTAFALVDIHERFSEICPRVTPELLANIKIMKSKCLSLESAQIKQ